MKKNTKILIILFLVVTAVFSSAFPAQAQIINFVGSSNLGIDCNELFDLVEEQLKSDESSSKFANLDVRLYTAFTTYPLDFIEEIAFRSAETQQAVVDMLLHPSTVERTDALWIIIHEVKECYRYGYPSVSGKNFVNALTDAIGLDKFSRPEAYRTDYYALFQDRVATGTHNNSMVEYHIALKEDPVSLIRALAQQSKELREKILNATHPLDKYTGTITRQRLLEIDQSQLSAAEQEILAILQSKFMEDMGIVLPADPDPNELARRNEILKEAEADAEETAPSTEPETTAATAAQETSASATVGTDGQQHDKQPGNIWFAVVITAFGAAAAGFFGGLLYSKKRR